MRFKFFYPMLAFVSMVLGSLCLYALAAGMFEQAKHRGELLVGFHYLISSYAAGAKFRTPESLALALAADTATRMHVPLKGVQIDPSKNLQAQTGKKFDTALIAITETGIASSAASGSTAYVPTGYAFTPMVIMRTDSDIRSWEHLKGRKVCIAEGGFFTGMVADRYGAREMIFKSPADSLLALRTGGCDAALHDSAMLRELIKLPEWKKFSARLESDERFLLAFVIANDDRATTKFLKSVTEEWKKGAYIDTLQKEAVRNIAFEVYLDQNVPDCH